MFGSYKFNRLVSFPGFNIGVNVLDGPQELPKEVLPVGVQTSTPTIPPAQGAYMLPIQIDANGALWVHMVGALGPVSGTVPVDGLLGPTSPADTASYTMVYDGNGGTWGRARATLNYELKNAPINRSFVNAQVTVTNTSAQILAADANRQYLLIQNNDPVGNIFISFGAAATLTTGVMIRPGGFYELNNVCDVQAIFAIGDIASNTNVIVVSA